MSFNQRQGRGAFRLAMGLALAASVMVGCDSLLEVELPDRVTGDAIEDPQTAQLQLNGIMGQIECGLSTFHYHASGYEDVWERVAGAYGSYSEYLPAPTTTTNCDPSVQNFAWYTALQIGRASAFELYDKIRTDWANATIQNRERILAQTALYAGISLEVLGEVFCEMVVDGGSLMTPDQTLALAEEWVTKALGHIQTTGDFELQNGITGPNDGNGIEEMAYAVRGRIRWARNNFSGATADFARVPDGFTAFISREGRPQRRNKVYFHANPGSGYVLGPITAAVWDDPPAGTFGRFDPPAYPGDGWPNPIPFTGYRDLAITSDGRAVAGYYPVTTSTHAGATVDPRIRLRMQQITAGGTTIFPVANKYNSQDDDMPLVSWREIALIRAEMNPATAVTEVNKLRALRGLPLVTYNPTTEDEIENMIIEERRRELWLEGRFWVTKIRNTDKLWFPRMHGEWPVSSENLFGGVRLAMPESEYVLNQNIAIEDRGTQCPASEAPVIIG